MSRTLTIQLDDETHREASQLQRAVDDAEEGLARGRWVEHRQVAAKLRWWASVAGPDGQESPRQRNRAVRQC